MNSNDDYKKFLEQDFKASIENEEILSEDYVALSEMETNHGPQKKVYNWDGKSDLSEPLDNSLQSIVDKIVQDGDGGSDSTKDSSNTKPDNSPLDDLEDKSGSDREYVGDEINFNEDESEILIKLIAEMNSYDSYEDSDELDFYEDEDEEYDESDEDLDIDLNDIDEDEDEDEIDELDSDLDEYFE